MVEIESLCTARTLLLEALHVDLIAVALRVRADVLRNIHLDMDAQTLEAAAVILEAHAQRARSALPEHADRLMHELTNVQAAEATMIRLRHGALRVLPEPVPSSSPPKSPASGAKSSRRTAKPTRAPKERGPR